MTRNASFYNGCGSGINLILDVRPMPALVKTDGFFTVPDDRAAGDLRTGIQLKLNRLRNAVLDQTVLQPDRERRHLVDHRPAAIQ
jgi:hypothetical protein